MNLKGNLTSKGLQGSIGKSRMQGILGTNPAAIPISVDNALSLSSTNPVQNKVITQAITNRLWSDEVKAALLQIVEKVAYVDEHGQDYYDALYDALYPPVGLDSIGAVFDSSATIYNTMTLDDLKQYLTVTAYYTSGDSEVVDSYTLSGSMDAGTQTITVAYGGKTTTFTVTVVEWVTSITAVFTQSGTIYDTDTLDTLEQYLAVTATYADSTTATVSDYTLSGTLTAGTSTITVSYGGKTDTFNVTVTGVVYLFKDGDECTSLTGGWDTKGFNTSGGSHIAENDGEALLIQLAGGGNNARSLSTVNKINLSGYTKICFVYEIYNAAGTGTHWCYFPATIANSTTQSGAYGSDYSSNRLVPTASMTNPYPSPPVRGTTDRVISSYTSRTSAYISINLNLYSGYTAGAYAKVFAIYLKP